MPPKKERTTPPFRGLTGNAQVWLDGKRIVDFLLAIIELLASLRGCGKRNLSKWAFSKGVGDVGLIWAQILGRCGHLPQSFYGPLDRGMMYVGLYSCNFATWSFHTKKLCHRLRQNLDFTGKNSKIAFCATQFGGLRGKVHGSSMARWKARGRLPISANWTFFASFHGRDAMSGYWSKLWCAKGW